MPEGVTPHSHRGCRGDRQGPLNQILVAGAGGCEAALTSARRISLELGTVATPPPRRRDSLETGRRLRPSSPHTYTLHRSPVQGPQAVRLTQADARAAFDRQEV